MPSLDDLWREAEGLGLVEVDHPLWGETPYRASIRFDRSSGSKVYARSNGLTIHDALMGAIREARSLKNE